MNKTRAVVWMLGLAVFATQALAEKPDWEEEGHGKGHGKKHQRTEQPAVEIAVGGYFDAHQRAEASAYYGRQSREGHCPPGLAKKHNGCQPPGQAKKWELGRPLARDVVVYPVPRDVVVKIGLPPAGYRYVRVLGDVLMVAIGTNMVVDAIEDLMK